MKDRGSAPFKDRHDAGLQLAAALTYLKKDRPVILALPRGGVPVAYEVAHELTAPLEVLLVRKIGAPHFPELGIGAVVDGQPHQTVINRELVHKLNVSSDYIESELQRQLDEIERRRRLYCGERPRLQIYGRTVIVVDDGIATGGTMAAALKGLKKEGVDKLVFAVPVAPRETLDDLCADVDDGVCLVVPRDFQSVGMYYEDFDQTGDDEVIELLDRQYVDLSGNPARRRLGGPRSGESRSGNRIPGNPGQV